MKRMKLLPFVHHHDFVSNLPPNHRFPMKKFHGIMKYLRVQNVVAMKQVYKPSELSKEVRMWDS